MKTFWNALFTIFIFVVSLGIGIWMMTMYHLDNTEYIILQVVLIFMAFLFIHFYTNTEITRDNAHPHISYDHFLLIHNILEMTIEDYTSFRFKENNLSTYVSICDDYECYIKMNRQKFILTIKHILTGKETTILMYDFIKKRSWSFVESKELISIIEHIVLLERLRIEQNNIEREENTDE